MRSDVAEAFRDFVRTHMGNTMPGRSGGQLLSGDDALFSRLANRLGYEVGYRPQLHLIHHISSNRLTWRYLLRLMKGHGHSDVILARLLGASIDPLPLYSFAFQVAKGIAKSLISGRLCNLVPALAWSYGRYLETRKAVSQ